MAEPQNPNLSPSMIGFNVQDKWKTLVHTAKISPQQRRGEPVPQELLNRVLNAHGYWSQQHMETLALPKPESVLLL